MTIKPGEEWGRAAPKIGHYVPTATDCELAGYVRAGAAGPFAATGGDLHRAVGSPSPVRYSQIVPVDVLGVSLDGGEPLMAVAHVVARNGWWRGPIVAVCNVDHIGTWNVAPRAHPNDGRADVIEVSAGMRLRARWQAWRRLPQGTHVPHPDIATRSVKEATFEFPRPLTVWIDGVRQSCATRLTITVRPDAFELLV